MGSEVRSTAASATFMRLADCCRFLNMLSVLESVIEFGTGRELPVVGFVGETMVLGVIVSFGTC